MKTGFVHRTAGVWGMVLGFGSSTALAAAIGFNLSPSIFTDDFVGKVDLNISNLTSGMTVNVDEYADLNTNGVIDAGDLLLGSFQLTDGQLALVSGLRNLNVSGDDDGLTNGQILVQYNYPGAGGGVWAGKFLFRVSDPASILTAGTQAVSVVQYDYPQTIAGRITFAVSGLPLTNCLVGAVGLGSAALLTLTDTNGNYLMHVVPGSYVVVGFNQQGAVFNQNQITVISCGQAVTNNIVVTNGAFSISGRVTDSGTGAGIPDLQVDAHTPDNLGANSFTDTNGNYTLQVTANTWSLHPTTGAAAERGYVDHTRSNIVVTSASVSGVNFSLSKPTALIYGSVKDTHGNPVIGIQISTRDPANNFHPVGRSFATDGSYSIGVLAGTWNNVAPNSGDLALQGFSAGSGANVTLVAGQTTNLNFVVTRTNFPTLTSPVHISSSQFQFLLNGLAGRSYTIQTVTNLEDTSWLALLTTNVPCTSVFILDSQATNNQRFYRALILP